MSQQGDIKTQYESLRAKHLEILGQQTQQQVAAAAPQGEEEAQGGENPTAPVVLESLAKLEAEIGVEQKTPSEISNVDIIKAKDGSLWLLSSSNRTLGKHILVGGYGTGQWVAQSECSEPGVAFTVGDGDKTVIQIDEASFGGEGAQGVSTLTIYKLLLRAETEKNIAEHRMSFVKASRKAAVAAGQDGFDIELKQSMVFKCCRDPRAGAAGEAEKITCKNFFSKFVNNLPSSLQTVVRFRFERVGQNFKIQRPYVLLAKAVVLEKEKPLKLS